MSTSQNNVTICGCTELYVPNAFTPGLNINNKFFALGEGILFFHMSIYNRWGGSGLLVYETFDISQGWDGTCGSLPAPEDVYVYQIEYTIECGSIIPKYTQGIVTVIR